jgi:HEAT repeat protein
LTDIGDARAADALIKLIGDSSEGTRYVIAYHGPKMKNAKLDAAILGKARSGDDALFTAWAARGFSEYGRAFPEQLTAAAVSSKQPRARAEVAEVLAQKPDERNIRRLVALLGDEQEVVRMAAAKAVGNHAVQDARIKGALVSALDKPGDAARQQECAALVKLTGQQWQYDAQGDAAARQKTIAQWKAWWGKQGGKR